jgi:hypothetical protein
MKPFNKFKDKKGLLQRITSHSLRIILVLLFIAIGYVTVLATPALATPTIYSFPLQDGQINVTYIATLTAYSDDPASVTWQLVGGTLPLGLTLSTGTGTISGVPTTAGTYSFMVQASDSTPPASSPASFSITINPPPFVISTSTLYDGEENVSYSATIIATGGTTPYTWSIISGSIPSGLSISSTTGYISGIPKIGSSGTHSFTVRVTDSSSPQRTTQQTLSIYIEKGTFAPIVTIGTGLEAGSTKVKMDGKQVASLDGGESMAFNLDLGESVTVTVDEIVNHPSEDGVRFQAEDNSQVVSETQQDAYFEYYTEYELEIQTYPSQVTTISGSGWHKKNSSTTINARATVEKDNQTQYKFSYWLLPNSTEASTESLNFTVTSPGVLTAYYDTYYKLSVDTLYGTVDGTGWYKSGTTATWALVDDSVPMEGILGFFQGKYRAVTSSGSVTMDGPKVVTVLWEPDYLLPYILIPLSIAVIILAIVGFYFLLRRPAPETVAVGTAGIPPIGPRPIPQQHTTVVMIENKETQHKQLPGTTKEQLMEKFAELLDTYEAEMKTSLQSPRAPQINPAKGNMIAAPIPYPPESDVFDGEVVDGESTETLCGTISKKLLRTVAGKWRQIKSSTITSPASDDDEKETTGLSVTWGRDLYHEWEINKCTLPAGHKGNHKGEKEIVYSMLNTVSIKQSYDESQAIEPPSPHFSESMPELEPDADQIVPAEELPPDTF